MIFKLINHLYGSYHLDLCKNVFGNDMPGPDVDATNLYYGGTGIVGNYLAISLSNHFSAAFIIQSQVMLAYT